MITIDRITETQPGEIIEALTKSGFVVVSMDSTRVREDGTSEALGVRMEKIDNVPEKVVDLSD